MKNTCGKQKRWKVVSIKAERKTDGEVLDWYSQLPACVKDNDFFTEAPGTGAVGELHAEESYTFENWLVEELNEKYMQIKVNKVFEEQAFTFTIRFEVSS